MPVGLCDYWYPPHANPVVVQVHLQREGEGEREINFLLCLYNQHFIDELNIQYIPK
jgi:hypothetical protein